MIFTIDNHEWESLAKSHHKKYWAFYSRTWLQRLKHRGWRLVRVTSACVEENGDYMFYKKSHSLFLCMCTMISHRLFYMSVVSQTTWINQLRKPIFLSPKAWFLSPFENNKNIQYRLLHHNPDSKVHGANMGPTWVLSAPDGPHVGPMNLAIREDIDSTKYWERKNHHGNINPIPTLLSVICSTKYAYPISFFVESWMLLVYQ